MKKFKQIIVMSLILAGLSVNAQQNHLYSKEAPTVSPEESIGNSPVRDPNATNITVGNTVIDKRAAKYYNAGELNNITEEKAKKINATYLNTFEFTESKNNLDAVCLEKIKNNFDLGPYNHKRKMNERVSVQAVFEGCTFKISLFSWNEVNSIK